MTDELKTFGQQCAEICRAANADRRARGVPLLKWEEVGEIIDAADAARPTKRRTVNGRDLIFDAIAAACGIDQSKPIARGLAATVATAKRDILEIDGTVTPEAIAARAKTLRATLPKDSTWGPSALAKYWSTLAPKVAPKVPESTAPVGWLDTLNRLHPDSAYARGGLFEIEKATDYAWQRLDADTRAQIVDALGGLCPHTPLGRSLR